MVENARDKEIAKKKKNWMEENMYINKVISDSNIYTVGSGCLRSVNSLQQRSVTKEEYSSKGDNLVIEKSHFPKAW